MKFTVQKLTALIKSGMYGSPRSLKTTFCMEKSPFTSIVFNIKGEVLTQSNKNSNMAGIPIIQFHF